MSCIGRFFIFCSLYSFNLNDKLYLLFNVKVLEFGIVSCFKAVIYQQN